MERVDQWFDRTPTQTARTLEEQREYQRNYQYERRQTESTEARERRLRNQRLLERQSHQRPFAPLSTTFDPNPGWQVCYGTLHHIAGRIYDQLDLAVRRDNFRQGEFVKVPWGKVKLRAIKTDDRYVSGGELWTSNGTIFDVRPFFMQSYSKTIQLYDTTDLAAIMEQARRELNNVGLWSQNNAWYRVSSITDYILRLPEFRSINFPALKLPGEMPGPSSQLIGSVVCGFIPGPIYEYDLVSAYASGLIEVPELRPYIDYLNGLRQQLTGKPAQRQIKIAQSVMPGKLISDRVNPRWHNKPLGIYTRALTRKRLVEAMNLAQNKGGTIFRWYIDGFYTDADIEPAEGITDGELGTWKKSIHEGGMLIVRDSLFRLYGADGQVNKERTNGWTDIDWEAVRDNPLSVLVTRTSTNWQTFQEKRIKLRLLFEGGQHTCEYCHDGYHLTRESFDQEFF
jgi:hypothetical protein